jgi:hypothetical protein
MNGGKSEGVEDWIQLTPERIQWWNFVWMVMNLRAS